MSAPKHVRADPEAYKEFNRRKYEKYGDSIRRQTCEWIEAHPQRYLLLTAKNRAIRTGREFAIVESDLEWPEVCPVRGVKLRYAKMGEGWCPSAASIDRIDNSRGYVPGNVRVISSGANSSKGTKAA